jgi:hypothetical protein
MKKRWSNEIWQTSESFHFKRGQKKNYERIRQNNDEKVIDYKKMSEKIRFYQYPKYIEHRLIASRGLGWHMILFDGNLCCVICLTDDKCVQRFLGQKPAS